MIEFEEIYRRYFGDVYRYALKLSGSESRSSLFPTFEYP